MENTFIPMVSGIVELVIRVGVALIFPIFLGQNGIYLAEVLAWTGAAVLLYISYKIKIHALLKGNSEMLSHPLLPFCIIKFTYLE